MALTLSPTWKRDLGWLCETCPTNSLPEIKGNCGIPKLKSLIDE